MYALIQTEIDSAPAARRAARWVSAGPASCHLASGLGPDVEQACADTAFRAWRLIHASHVPPLAVFCDASLPDSDVWSLLARLRRESPFRQVPFVLVSEKVDKSLIIKALQLGADEVYDIDADPAAVRRRLAFLRSFKSEQESPVQEEETRRRPPVSSPRRLLDITLSSLGLLLAMPLLLPAALLLWVESGYPLERVQRVGMGYQVFDLYQLRSRRKERRDTGEYTRLGRWFSRMGLTRWPQLLNVFLGDLTLSGYEPLPLQVAEQLTTDEWAGRFLTPAGLTGPWAGITSASARRRLEKDFSLSRKPWSGLKIVLTTLPLAFRDLVLPTED
jgi:lipopolysaccharide/colanic/teichoic acid biosynthesis glycosyltransferase